jgi:hypothetical protein
MFNDFTRQLNQKRPISYYQNRRMAKISIGNVIGLGAQGYFVTSFIASFIYDELISTLALDFIGTRRMQFTDVEPITSTHWNKVVVSNRVIRRGNIAAYNWGIGGENSGRILLSYASNSTGFFVAEIDIDGKLIEEPVYIAGCVIFPVCCLPDLGCETNFNRLTSVCPSGHQSTRANNPSTSSLDGTSPTSVSVETDDSTPSSVEPPTDIISVDETDAPEIIGVPISSSAPSSSGSPRCSKVAALSTIMILDGCVLILC